MLEPEERPGPHPEPPENLLQHPLPVIEIQKPWFRIHKSHHSPLYFGQTGDNRFDAPTLEYRVMYIASDPHGAFIETFGSQTGIRVVSASELSIRSISELSCMRLLKLVDITGPGVAQLGADARLATGSHRIAQLWATKFWSHPEQVDGIYYRARHDLEQTCAAIFERAESVFEIANTQLCVSRNFSKTLAKILNTYQFGLVV